MHNKVRRLKICCLTVFVLLLAASLVWMANSGKEGEVSINAQQPDGKILSCSLRPQDPSKEIIEIIAQQQIPGGETIRFRAAQPGSGWYMLMFEEENSGGMEMIHIMANRNGHLWIDYVPQGSEMLSAVCLLGILMLLMLLCAEFHASELDTPYSYKLSAIGGGILFTAFALITNIVILINSLRGGSMLTIDSIIIQLSHMPSAVNGIVLPVMIIVFAAMSISNAALLIREGRRLKNILGAALGALLILGILAGILLRSQFMQTLAGKSTLTFYMLFALRFFLCGIVCYAECLTASIVVHAIKAARHVPAKDKDYIIILGCSIGKDGRIYPLLRGRIDRAVQFAREQLRDSGKAAILVPSGGKGSDECMSEAEAMQAYLLKQGLSPEEILPETHSENTWQNMQFSKALIEQRDPQAKIAFSTTNYHVLRAGIYASEAGLHAEGMGSRTAWYYWPNAFARELVALFVNKKKQHILLAGVILLVSILISGVLYIMVM